MPPLTRDRLYEVRDRESTQRADLIKQAEAVLKEAHDAGQEEFNKHQEQSFRSLWDKARRLGHRIHLLDELIEVCEA